MKIDKPIVIVCVYLYTLEWNFVIDVDFLCKIQDRIILKSLLYCVNFTSAIGKESVVSIP